MISYLDKFASSASNDVSVHWKG